MKTWDEIFKEYSEIHSMEVEEVRHFFIPLLNWLKQNYPSQSEQVSIQELCGVLQVLADAIDYAAENNCNHVITKEDENIIKAALQKHSQQYLKAKE